VIRLIRGCYSLGVVVKGIVGVAAYTVDCSWVTVKVP